MFLKLHIFLLIILNNMLIDLINCGRNKKLVINKMGLNKADVDGVGLIFYVNLNNTSDDNINFEVKNDRCCLKNGDNIDCNVLKLVGCADFIPGGTSKTIKLVAPLLEPYNRKGYCLAYIDSWSGDKIKMRDPVKFKFDIKVKDIDFKDSVKDCSNIDEDPLNDCKHVNCDVHYNGYKPLFDSKIKRCITAVNCLGDSNEILNPYINKCVDNVINSHDIEYIKALPKNDRKVKDVLIIRNSKKLAENINSTNPVNDYDDGNICKKGKKKMSFFRNIKSYFSCNKYTFSILGLVILVQCLLICSMLFFVSRTCGCYKKKVVERKYFNYRQDASVTTPLIATSNIDTDTTDFQYLSESSNIDNKIKCYKACQKEFKNNVKLSLSDDILTKCLNRRDWTKPKSETITEIPKEEEFKDKKSPEKNEVKINIENEANVNIIENKQVNTNLEYVSSEMEIKNHTYNSAANSNLTGFKPSTHSRKLGYFKTDVKAVVSNSTEKAAQASFSNDSIDDFLSERGMTYLLGENISKYSFNSSSNPGKSSTTSASSRTSKNNVIKNVLSLLKRKSKVTSSDPVLKKSKDSIDLELIHMSRASVFSSSNERLKDSRTSL